MGFADCKEVAITCSGSIPDSEVCYGVYAPLTPRNEWHKGWQNNYDPVFTHFWVEVGDKIIDRAAEQFGGPSEQIVDKSDIRYVKVGKYDKDTDKTIPLVSDPVILWPTMTRAGGTVQVIWKGYLNYLNRLDTAREDMLEYG